MEIGTGSSAACVVVVVVPDAFVVVVVGRAAARAAGCRRRCLLAGHQAEYEQQGQGQHSQAHSSSFHVSHLQNFLTVSLPFVLWTWMNHWDANSPIRLLCLVTDASV